MIKKRDSDILKYILDGEEKEIKITVDIKRIKGLMQERQSLDTAYTKVEGSPINFDPVNGCINASFKLKSVKEELIKLLKEEYKKRIKFIEPINKTKKNGKNSYKRKIS